MKKLLLAATLVALLAGCGSSVKLDSVPVEDKTGAAVSGGPAGGDANSAAKSGVTAVDLGKAGADAGGPAGASIVYFDYDSFVVKPEFLPVVENQARYLRADSKRKAMLEGHTDDRGGREYNLALGQRRAEAVGRALALLGVAGNQMEAVSFGKEKPAASGLDEASMAKNRRVEVKYR